MALLAVLALLGAGAIYLFVRQLNAAQLEMARETTAELALAQAADALIGYAASQPTLDETGYLVVPDTGWTGTPEGNSEGTVGVEDVSVIGKVPWKTLGIGPLRDSSSECLWYVVSGRFKGGPKTAPPFNWDTAGQIDVIDGSGNVLMQNMAALVIAPGSVLDSQDRSLANPALKQCGGNYDARNYLDSYNDVDAVSSQVNYFAGSVNNQVAAATTSKQFVLARNNHYNDHFRGISVEQIFRPIIRRQDFADEVHRLLDDLVPHVKTIGISGAKGTDDIDCNLVSNKDFCDNWKEMLFATELSPPAPITIDGASTPVVCMRVVIFAGQRTLSQSRLTSTDKANKSNYLEGTNLVAFVTPTASSSDFDGKRLFNPGSPSADLVRCVEP